MTNKYKDVTYKTHPFIEEYFNLIDSGQVLVCKEQYLLRKYVVKKLAQSNVYIDAGKIEQAVKLKEKYFYPEFPFQRFIDCFVYGVFYDDGTPVFNRFFIMMGRGNGKNGYISPNIWYMTTRQHGITNYNVEIVANSETQVKTSFVDVTDMMEKPAFNELMKKAYRWTKEIIKSLRTASVIRWHTSNAKTKDTLRSGCVVFDEVHQYEDYDRLNVFITGLGKIPSARVFYITTDGFVRGKVLDDFKQEAQDTFAGERPNSRTFFFICKLDSKEEIDDPAMWVKANPAWHYLPDLRIEVLQEHEESRTNAELRRGFVTKRMNLPSQDSAAPVTEWENIVATNQPFPDFTGQSCIGGLDFAETSDFVGCGLLFRKDDKYYWLHHSFVCAAGLEKAQPKFNVTQAAEDGLCTIVREKTIPVEMITDWFIDQSRKYSLLRVSIDSFRESVVKNAFYNAGLATDVVRKGSYTHAKLAPQLDILYASHNIVYGDDAMMRWYTNNVYKEYDKKGNVSYEKIEPIRRKTDGWHAFLAAMCSDFKNPLSDGAPVDYSSIRVYSY